MELSKLNTSDNSTGKLTPQSIQNGINTTAQAQTLLGAQGTHKDTDTVTHVTEVFMKCASLHCGGQCWLLCGPDHHPSHDQYPYHIGGGHTEGPLLIIKELYGNGYMESHLPNSGIYVQCGKHSPLFPGSCYFNEDRRVQLHNNV